MKRILASILGVAVLAFLTSTGFAGDLPASMHGKWSVKRTNENGEKLVQKLVLGKDSIKFRVMTEGGSTVMYVEGKAQIAKAGKISVIQLSSLQGGQSDSDMQSIDQEFHAPIMASYNTLYVTVGLDGDSQEEPRLDAYKKD